MKNSKKTNGNSRKEWIGYLIALLTSAGIGAICFPLSQAIGYHAIGFIFLMSVPVLSIFIGRGPVMMAALLNFAVWNFFFIPPLMTFHIEKIHDLIALITYLGVAVASGVLITRIRKNELDLIRSQERIGIINSFLESLNHTGSIREVVRMTQDTFKKQFDAGIIVYLKEKSGENLSFKSFGNTSLHNDEEFNVAQAVFMSGEQMEAGIKYFPLEVQRGNIGVIGIDFGTTRIPDTETNLLIRSFIAQLTSALDREINIDIVKEKEIFMESQKLSQTILSSVSHELKAPIAIISNAVSSLYDEQTASNGEIRRQLSGQLDSAARRLAFLVENILDMSKIESGHLHLHRQSCDITQLFGMALTEVKSEFVQHNLKVNISENLPALFVDIHWFIEALINILRNAIHTTPSGRDIYIDAYQDENHFVVIEILDSGTGVPGHALPKLFDKFYRVPGIKNGETGLGLAIAKAIVEAHKGIIFAKNREGGGLSVIMVMGRSDQD